MPNEERIAESKILKCSVKLNLSFPVFSSSLSHLLIYYYLHSRNETFFFFFKKKKILQVLYSFLRPIFIVLSSENDC